MPCTLGKFHCFFILDPPLKMIYIKMLVSFSKVKHNSRLLSFPSHVCVNGIIPEK
ncbi:unnamed protein product [Linum tenue]|uniref:Uncharacterized protein n=1 Tax=Linum tenue TaxID=586396 RepID=A0AAV0QY40_9ROSI|nr:unnamed protein product [Linum tenue]